MQRITLTRPDDWHLHLRAGPAMKSVLAHSARQFARAIVMPNLVPPVTTVTAALRYREEILDALPPDSTFTPLMALYLTDATAIEEVRRAAASDAVIGFKLYPAGATTNSDAGVTDPAAIYPLFEAMERHDVPLLVHGEVIDPEVDIFDREKAFLDRHLTPITERFPALRVVVEHTTTRDAVQFVEDGSDKIAATITPQHLMYNRNALLAGGIRPHHYCLPVLKRESHRLALVQAATGGNPKFFLGTDSAPHSQSKKESACGCAGCYSAHAALELYAEVFEDANALDRLDDFASAHGASFYGLPRNAQSVILEKTEWVVPETYSFGEDRLVPLRAGHTMKWRLSMDY